MRCANTPVGNLSGGERKRTSIAVELIADPRIMFMDEPTSGLDSFTALSVMRMVKRLAEEGRTVVATIHQPSNEIVAEFSRLHLLARGHTVYSGPPSGALTHFSNLGFPCPNYTNPADFFMRLLQDDAKVGEAEEEESPEAKERRHALPVLINSPCEVGSPFPEPSYNDAVVQDLREETERMTKRASGPKALAVVTWREFLNFSREPMALRVRVGQSIFIALLLGIIYLQIGNWQSTIKDRIGVLFCLMAFAVLGTMTSVVMTCTPPLASTLFDTNFHKQSPRSASCFCASTATACTARGRTTWPRS